MPTSRVIPKRLPVSPGQDSRFTIRHHNNQWWVHYKPEGANPIPADHPHADLVERVNALKEAEGNQPGGSFSINEHFQVIARMNAPTGYDQQAIRVVDVSEGSVFTYKAKITFVSGTLDPTSTPTSGAPWTGPLCGSTYSFAAPGSPKPPSNKMDEVWFELNGTNIQLSAYAGGSTYPPSTGPLAHFLKALRIALPTGGRFRVNEHGRAFTANTNTYIGRVPVDHWFDPISPLA